MRILIIRSYPSFMDVEKNTYNIQEVGLAKALVRKGNVCDILFWTDQEQKEVDLPVDGTGIIHVYYRHGKTALKNTVFSDCKDLFSSYDILQTAEYNQMQSWLLARKYPDKTMIYHGPYYSSFNKRYNLMCSVFDKFFLKKYLKLNTKFITKSTLATDFLMKKGIKSENIKTIGVGIDTQMLQSSDSVCNEPLFLRMKEDTGIKILYIGRFEERRNIPFILNVFREVLNQISDARLYMIGTGAREYVDKVWRQAEDLKIRDQIFYQEKMEQKYLSNIYKMADYFLLPTEYEIFGMVLLEAMYYENIVITTENGGSKTLIQDGINGYIRNTESPKEWSDLILKGVSEKEDSIKIKRKARKTIENNYLWDKLSADFEEAYNNIGNN